ncbi:uncharacterized protein [Physcomitrium patens]|uniref:DUF7875 domain-containing protein n=1 Tax=Physcomitrium patens TaxID=3218 RepID=A0A7I4EFS2_PHYPA
MALRRPLGASSGEVMREDAIPCERITRIFATVAGIGGVFLAWPLCHIHYGPRVTWPRVYRWQVCGAVGCAVFMGTFARLWEPACEPQNIAAYESQAS